MAEVVFTSLMALGATKGTALAAGSAISTIGSVAGTAGAILGPVLSATTALSAGRQQQQAMGNQAMMQRLAAGQSELAAGQATLDASAARIAAFGQGISASGQEILAQQQRLSAQAEETRGIEEATALRRQLVAVLASQRARFSAAGLSLESGTPDTLAEAAQQEADRQTRIIQGNTRQRVTVAQLGALDAGLRANDARLLARNSEIAALGNESAAVQNRLNAGIQRTNAGTLRSQGGTALTSSYFQAGASLFDGLDRFGRRMSGTT